MRRHSFSFILGLLGCNAILDNQEAYVLDTGASPTLPSEGTEPAPDAPDASRSTDSAKDASCRNGEHRCAEKCVSDDDPAFGCGASDCAPCALDHAIATCNAGACAVRVCEANRADCNQVAADGCEADLTLFESCGSCTVSCTTNLPICAPVGETYGCIAGCPSDAPQRCDGECVDLLTNTAHCGECGHACGPIDRCIQGTCRWF